jgi:hypothetical protein
MDGTSVSAAQNLADRRRRDETEQHGKPPAHAEAHLPIFVNVSLGSADSLRKTVRSNPIRPHEKRECRPPPREAKPGPSAKAVSHDAGVAFFRVAEPVFRSESAEASPRFVINAG